jgi:hypothetical protein
VPLGVSAHELLGNGSVGDLELGVMLLAEPQGLKDTLTGPDGPPSQCTR